MMKAILKSIKGISPEAIAERESKAKENYFLDRMDRAHLNSTK
jgi:hypothetical protein